MKTEQEPIESKLKNEFCKRTKRWKVSRTTWLLFDFVCGGNSDSRNRLIADFTAFCKRKPPKRYKLKWEYAAEWYSARRATA